ncbi:hypothetical protein TNCV_3603291 [Trichonephila clavipes]|nr:hypothetical protein TNCV_3603291 [Trichonephila clavipes]
MQCTNAANVSTPVAVDQRAANYLEEAVPSFTTMWSRCRSSRADVTFHRLLPVFPSCSELVGPLLPNSHHYGTVPLHTSSYCAIVKSSSSKVDNPYPFNFQVKYNPCPNLILILHFKTRRHLLALAGRGSSQGNGLVTGACHEFEPSIAEEPQCRGRYMLNMSMLKRPRCGVEIRRGGVSSVASPLVRLMEGDPCPPQGVLLQNWDETELNNSVTLWCSKLRLTTGVTYPFAMRNFMGLDLAFAD